MYEHLRNQFISNLSNFSTEQIIQITNALDKAMSNYDLVEKETSLVVYNGDIPELVRLYIASKKLEGLSERSLKLYYGRLRIFFEYVQKNPLDVTTNEIRMFLARYQSQRGISDRTLDKFRQIINGFYTWCTDEEYTAKNPCRNIKEIKYEVKPRKSLTRFQLEQLRRACVTRRELAIVDTLYSTGCRVSELVNMRMSQINNQDKSIEIVGKGRKHNTVYFNTNAQLSIQEYIDSRTDSSDFLFVTSKGEHNQLNIGTVEKMFNRLARECGFFVTPHIMRHTAATLALQSGMELSTVQKMLGHANVGTTQIYAETSQEDVMNSHKRYVV